MNWPKPYCVVDIAENAWQELFEHGGYDFGNSWVIGWNGVHKCVWCDDMDTATVVWLLTGCTARLFHPPE